MPGKSQLVAAASGRKPKPFTDTLAFQKGYRPSVQQYMERVAGIFPKGLSSAEHDSFSAAYLKQFGKYPNRGVGLKYKSGPGVRRP